MVNPTAPLRRVVVPRVCCAGQARTVHVMPVSVKFRNKEKATRWAIRLGEQKVHVVAAALNLVGDRQMQLLFNEAVLLYTTDQAASLGGAFMKVMKDVEFEGAKNCCRVFNETSLSSIANIFVIKSSRLYPLSSFSAPP
jgi:hypothetical protein